MAPNGLDIRAASVSDLDALLPLIAEYQRFYEAQPDDDRNRRFFRRFASPSDAGLLLGAWDDGRAVGFACLYWTYSSVTATDIALLNDLLVVAGSRSKGVGRLLISAAMTNAKEHGCSRLVWQTAPDNHRAQRLYDQFAATRSEWIEYSVALR